MKIAKKDKLLLEKFKTVSVPKGFENLFSELNTYIDEVLTFKEIIVYDNRFFKIEIDPKIIEKEDDPIRLDYLEFAFNVVMCLNNYIIRLANPPYFSLVSNAQTMKDTLQGIPHFHDGKLVDVEIDNSDLLLTFELIKDINRQIFVKNPHLHTWNNRFHLSIKFNNVKFLEGEMNKAYILRREYRWLYDFEYQTVDNQHQIYLFEFSENKDLIFSCSSLEFVETKVQLPPSYQWQGVQGAPWWNLVRGKFIDTPNELTIHLSDKFIIQAKTTKKWQDNINWSNIYINGIFYAKSCEHVDEDLYWLIDNIYSLVFLVKKGKIKAMDYKDYEKKKRRIKGEVFDVYR